MGATDAGPALGISGLCVDFAADDGPVRAVHDLDFAVPRGEIVCLVGESGCGKSLTARAVLGLLPENASASGSILLRGPRIEEIMGKEGPADVLALPERRLRRLRGAGAAMIFQEPMTALNPVLRIGFQVEEALRAHLGLGARDARLEALRLLEEVGIPAAAERFDDHPHRLSGGMRQRVTIAMALSCRPDILLADEPTTALDATIQGQILHLLYERSRDRGMAVLLITHDLGVVARMASAVGVMYAGRLVERGPAEDILRRPLHPYTRGLLRCAPTRAAMGSRRLPAIPGTVPPPGSRPPGCPFAPRCEDALPRCREELPALPAGTAHAAACLRPAA